MKNIPKKTNLDLAWPFDQGPNVASLTTKQVIEFGYPVLQVIHYEDDHSWAFLCATTNEEEDFRLVHMKEMLAIDDSIRSIANLAPGMIASRANVGSEWEVEPFANE